MQKTIISILAVMRTWNLKEDGINMLSRNFGNLLRTYTVCHHRTATTSTSNFITLTFLQHMLDLVNYDNYVTHFMEEWDIIKKLCTTIQNSGLQKWHCKSTWHITEIHSDFFHCLNTYSHGKTPNVFQWSVKCSPASKFHVTTAKAHSSVQQTN
jgi:hypothetical protein